MHESGIAILFGLLVGAVMHALGMGAVPFQETIFFYFILPPIIFCQGYTLKKRNFFKYFHYISIFGVFGTLIQFTLLAALADLGANHFHFHETRPTSHDVNWHDTDTVYDEACGGATPPLALTAGECMLLAAVLSASDEVATLSLVKQKDQPKLGAILFGEGVINDAFSMVMFKSVL
jgi:NhaP-type Na+/H+ or K+/H+ antiporter